MSIVKQRNFVLMKLNDFTVLCKYFVLLVNHSAYRYEDTFCSFLCRNLQTIISVFCAHVCLIYFEIRMTSFPHDD